MKRAVAQIVFWFGVALGGALAFAAGATPWIVFILTGDPTWFIMYGAAAWAGLVWAFLWSIDARKRRDTSPLPTYRGTFGDSAPDNIAATLGKGDS